MVKFSIFKGKGLNLRGGASGPRIKLYRVPPGPNGGTRSHSTPPCKLITWANGDLFSVLLINLTLQNKSYSSNFKEELTLGILRLK